MFLPTQQLRIGEHLLQSAEVADAKGENGLSGVAWKMSGYSCREGQYHLPCDFDNTPGTHGEEASYSPFIHRRANATQQNLCSVCKFNQQIKP